MPFSISHPGLLSAENVSVSRSASLAVGMNAYAAPAATVLGGAPEIVGARFGCGTVIANAGSETGGDLPSVTPIEMLAKVPTSPGPGVPDSAPAELMLAHGGAPTIVKVSASASASLAAAANE